MEAPDRKAHWEHIYQTKSLQDVSWYQPAPLTSLQLIEEMHISKNAKIIDIGGGDSLLADHLLEQGYTDVTVLDISESALNRAKQRLGNKAAKVKWVCADVTTFKATETYDLWHDRAAFHFLTDPKDITSYITNLEQAIAPHGTMIIGTFSEQGPTTCSGINITQYSEAGLSSLFTGFEKQHCFTINHSTPFNTIQNFLFCRYKHRSSL